LKHFFKLNSVVTKKEISSTEYYLLKTHTPLGSTV
jgi:hypothetical protein